MSREKARFLTPNKRRTRTAFENESILSPHLKLLLNAAKKLTRRGKESGGGSKRD